MLPLILIKDDVRASRFVLALIYNNHDDDVRKWESQSCKIWLIQIAKEKEQRTEKREFARKCMRQAIAKPVLMEHVSSCRKLRRGFLN